VYSLGRGERLDSDCRIDLQFGLAGDHRRRLRRERFGLNRIDFGRWRDGLLYRRGFAQAEKFGDFTPEKEEQNAQGHQNYRFLIQDNLASYLTGS